MSLPIPSSIEKNIATTTNHSYKQTELSEQSMSSIINKNIRLPQSMAFLNFYKLIGIKLLKIKTIIQTPIHNVMSINRWKSQRASNKNISYCQHNHNHQLLLIIHSTLHSDTYLKKKRKTLLEFRVKI